METILIVLVTGALCIGCFFVGAKVGQKVSKGEELKLPTNPIEAIRESNEKREAAQEAEKLDVILSNIKNYNGTSSGQKDVPRG